MLSFTKIYKALFDAEILANLTFPHELPVGASTWYRTPPRIREKYMLHCVKEHAELVGATNFTLVPVFERHFARLKISSSNFEAREDKIREWCNLTGYHVWNLGWIPLNGQGFWAPTTWEQLDGWVWRRVRHNRGDEEVWIRKGVSEFEHTGQDERFLRTMCMIVEGNIDAVEKEGYLAADVINIACGHTYLGVGIEKGSLQMVRVLLRETKVVSRLHLYVYLRLALKRAEAQAFVTALLDAVSGRDKKRFAIDLFDKAISNSDMPLFDAVIDWVTTIEHWEGDQKLGIIEWCFKRVLAVRKRKKRRHVSLNSIKKTGVCAWVQPVEPSAFLAYAAPPTSHTVDTNARLGRGKEAKGEVNPQCRRPIEQAMSHGLRHWADWMLWAGADAADLP
jgi:hypothetical protein